MSKLLQKFVPLCSTTAAATTPLTQFQRFRGNINIQRPRKPHYERARVLAVTRTILPEPPKALNCFRRKEQAIIHNPYNDIIAREVFNWLNHSRMVGIFHVQSISADEMFKVNVALHRQNMHLKSYGRKIIEKAVEGTNFEAILPLFQAGHHYVVFSSEQRAAQLLHITKKAPQFILLAGIAENKLLSRNEFIDYAQLPGLQAMQAELVQTINMAGGEVLQQLSAHQRNLVNILDVHANRNEQTEQSTTSAAVSEPEEQQKA